MQVMESCRKYDMVVFYNIIADAAHTEMLKVL